MKQWKKNLVAAAVLVTVCTGIYLNWLYTDQQTAGDLTDQLNAEKVMSDELLALSGDMEVISDELTTASDYFAAVRLSRQQARDSALELLQEAMAYDDAAATGQASGQLTGLVSDALQEAQIESLVMAKGYDDCVTYMDEGTVFVAVAAPAEGLQQTDVAVISDIVTSQTEYDLTQLRIIEVN